MPSGQKKEYKGRDWGKKRKRFHTLKLETWLAHLVLLGAGFAHLVLLEAGFAHLS